MALKRKRSTGQLSSPMSMDASSPLPYFYTQSKPTPTEALYQKPTWSFPTYSSSPCSPETSTNGSAEDLASADLGSKLNARTRKRHRDNRPSDQSIYGTYIPSTCRARWLDTFVFVGMSGLTDVCRSAASTISKLYDAQRLHPHAEPVFSAPQQPALEERTQKSTLHSFWNIGVQPMVVDSSATSSVTSLEGEAKCEDCDASLRHADSMDVDMDGGMLEQESACNSCRRQICDRCAVLGLVRVCLPCASGRR